MDSNKKFHKLIEPTSGEGGYACPEFASQKKWRVQEKIDGTNIRILSLCNSAIANSHSVDFMGRTKNAQLHPKLLEMLQTINLEPLNEKFENHNAVLFGEGFGAGIQSGGIYRKDMSFILFDVYMNGRWSTREEVSQFAEMLNLETPHDFGLMTEDEIVSFVKSKPRGKYGNGNYILEGVIARSEPLVRFNTMSANPVAWKLKVKDFK